LVVVKAVVQILEVIVVVLEAVLAIIKLLAVLEHQGKVMLAEINHLLLMQVLVVAELVQLGLLEQILRGLAA
jgi:hypothetical protein